MKEKLPIKFFATRENDELRIEGGGGDVIPKWVLAGEELIQHSKILVSQLETLTEVLNKKKDFNIPFVFKVKLFYILLLYFL